MTIVVSGEPVGKPRMTQRDKWQKRACVVRYRVWADALRDQVGIQNKLTFTKPVTVHVCAFFSMPNGWSRQRKLDSYGEPHTSKPDGDNVLKAVLDALIENDQTVYYSSVGKYWDDGGGPRVEIELEPFN